ncbi:unnamed protein product [Trifolium pratense]|uniref:Uncharacterized protein n=1 Tax=Trifolium pratense TaxID=57577 RepID=A0ACB0MEX1_TRIPR|nr:unnamed protein product [Trifolium pratense]
MSSEASSSGGVDPPPQSLVTSELVNVPIFSSPTISTVHDVIPTLPIPTMAIPSVTAGFGRSKPPSGQGFMYGPPPTLGLGMPSFESDRYTSSRVTPTPLTTASVLSLRQQMDESNHEMVNLLTQQIGTVFNPLIQNTNESYQMLAFQMSRIADFFGTPPPPPRVNPITPQVILPAMSSTPVQQRPTYVAAETVPNPTPTPVVQEETYYPHEVNQMPQIVNQNPPVINPNPQVGSKVVAGKETVNAVTEVNKYSYRNNYKGKNPMTRTQWRRFQRKQKLTAKEAEAGGKAVATQKAEKVEMAKRPVKERLSIILEEPIAENAQGGAEDEDDMEDDDLLDEGSDFDVMVNVVSILPLEYDVPTEVNELEEDFEALNLADHKPMCYYVMQNGLYDTDLHSHNVVLANYEGKTGHSLGAVQLEVRVGSTVRKTLFMVIAAKPNYNLLLGREWIHGVGAVPSTMHQRLIIWREDGLVENVEADQSAYVSETGTVTLQNFDKNLASIAPCGEQDAAFDPNEVCLDGSIMMSLMIESPAWDRITAYAAENRIKMALEAINVQENMAVEANDDLRDKLALEASEVNDGEKQKLDCIYDDEPLGFEKDPHSSIQRMQAQDPLQEVDIGDGSVKRPTYISANIDPTLKEKMVELLKKYRDCFAWDYNEMPGLSRNLVEHRLPLRPDKKPVKQLPRRFAPEIMTKIKAEIERLLKCKFIRTTRYVEWLANIVPVIKKNGSLRVCIDFRDLNNATPKDEYSMPVAEMQWELPLDHYENRMLDELTDVDEERLQALDALIRQKERIARAYNKRVKSKLFDVGDLVWKVILPMDRRDRVFGKWSPNWEGPFKISQVLLNGAYEIEELTPEKRSVNMNGKYLKKYKPMLQEITVKNE